jgi:predicted DNA binding CopG/RHH family protein
MKKNNKKDLPKFKNEEQEHEFWAKHSALDYFDIGTAQKITMLNLKPSLKTISIRLPEMMVAELKLLANKRDIPYQSLLKIFLSERIEKELKHSA